MRVASFTLVFVLIFQAVSSAGFLDFLKDLKLPAQKQLDDDTIISGLKEALSIGTENAVTKVSQLNGYLENPEIKIPMPEKIQKVADVLKKIGYQNYVDDFVTSMNRSAEQAAPKATSHFVDAVKQMSFDDAKNILNGPETAATEYFKQKTWEGLYGDLKPIISNSMDKVGVTKIYKDMMGKYTSLPFMKEETLDLDNYVTDEALDGLFHMIAQEEKKIRTDPSARVTDLLKTVFGK